MAGRVLVAGVGGVGRALALRLAARGAPVHLVARSADNSAASGPGVALGGSGVRPFSSSACNETGVCPPPRFAAR